MNTASPPALKIISSVGLAQPTIAELNRYRLHHGTNLGSIFVLERWIFPSMFLDSTSGRSELSAVSEHIKHYGLKATREKWEKHWNTALTPEDWRFLRDTARVTSVRLPVGYFTLGPAFCAGTPFEAVGKVYVNAWAAVKRYITTAAEHGIAVLVDMHGLPGGANDETHSGTDSGKAEFWENEGYRSLATSALMFIVKEVVQDPVLRDWVLGVQLVNEAIWGAGEKGMWDWYNITLAAIATVDPTLPIYISDAWDLGPALDYASKSSQIPIVVDTHKYYCFSDKDKTAHPDSILTKIPHELADQYGEAFVIGEWSCVLSEESWSQIPAAARPATVHRFAQAQSQRWNTATAGAFFWNFKMSWKWGFVEQIKAQNLLPPPGRGLSPQQIREAYATAQISLLALQTKALGEHVAYWNEHVRGGVMEHWRYQKGYGQGFSDALAFWRNGGDVIGLAKLWVKKRTNEYAPRGGKWVWQYEHGVKKGMEDFRAVVGV
ncbi:putative glucan 1,3-beta-glucosidase precursor [Geopyxis carbonaria]|nr:putative glucan 1,3-beta-glucosidase precursor [Geopyxis carbonaria]